MKNVANKGVQTMKMKNTGANTMKWTTAILAGLMSSALTVNASVITWTVGTISTSDGVETDVSNSGILVEAVNFGAATVATTINGVTFEAFTDGGDNLSTDHLSTLADKSADGVADLYTGANTSYNTLFDGLIFDNLASEVTYTLTGLSIGQAYEVQLFIADDRNTPADKLGSYLSVDGSGNTLGGNSTVYKGSANPALVFTGTFEADALTQVFTAQSFEADDDGNGTILQAFQLRTVVPEPSTLALLGAGLTVLMVTRRRSRAAA